MPEPLITRYRPNQLEQVVGHTEVCAALRRAIDSGPPHAYLLTGITGVGKTTIARIIAGMVGAEVLEIDAASSSGVDSTRDLVEVGTHRALSGAGRRMIIVDEAHTLSKQAWQVLLKTLEEPPEHLFYALCTTESEKVPATIKSRCYHVVLRPLRVNEIEDLLAVICDLEDWKVNDDVFNFVVQSSEGSARQGLTLLEAVHAAPDLEEAKRILPLVLTSDALKDFCQLLLKGGGKSWGRVQTVLAGIGDDEFEQASITVGRYMAKVMQNSDNEKSAYRAWTILDALIAPTTTWDRKASFCAAVGRILWGIE